MLLHGLLGGWLLGASPVLAAPYEVEPEVDGELELLALLEDGTLSAETWAALVALRRAGVEPEQATRAALYALPGLTYAEVDERLRERGASMPEVLTDEERRRLAPFLVNRVPGELSGDARLLTAFALSDSVLPPVALQVRAGGLAGLRVGVLATWARRRLGTLRRDARTRSLVVDAPGSAVLLPKFHAQWTGTSASVLVGTYRLGFGQRLTLDTTALPSPEGFLADDGVRPPGALERECLLSSTACAEAEREADVTPDFRWDEGFRGVAGTVRGAVGRGLELSLTGFGSYQSRSLQRSAVLDRATCESSRMGASGCEAPEVLVPLSRARLEPLRARTLPGVFSEWAGGANATLALSPRAQVGVTGWAARPVWPVKGAMLDFQPHARYPMGGGFGAVGLDASWGLGAVDLFFEGSRSFDSAPGGGGSWAALQRTVLSGTGQELELALRYYGRGFANPYSGATSGPDLLEGQRVRNELGARLRYLYRDAATWRFRGQVDGWTLPADGAVKGTAGLTQVRASARVDWLAWTWLRPSLQLEAREAGLGQALACSDTEDSAEPEEVPACSRGSRWGATARVRSEFSESVSVAAQSGYTRVVEPGTSKARNDGRALIELKLRPLESLRLGARIQWKDEDLSERTRLRQEVRTTVDLGWTLLSATTVRGRYVWVVDLKDARAARTPPDAPRHLFQLEVETRF
ncbi:hypothetical protein FJV41_14555 [Myxococcus llanfairpwllgwyngyllgogerychwyrndrobwllllantysiliogogogochensis]|uniref:Uncharacterized protein n=2 Tax=Myxococcus llanfairpwllgwyngyllgogerychwyrndrobwllllantysiliogogogochensis TaxID=2590453 RepID=A0A540X1V1_9BACT|nr:hypothetical protein FJV41_14555 [Myxococcus llanfairpwllgwyngyllgogerychwyrndrobwllllantysiliogogogochensis]